MSVLHERLLSQQKLGFHLIYHVSLSPHSVLGIESPTIY